jgi:exopolysaccharide biosynthesis protein
MKKLAVALLATTVMSTPVAFAASDNYQQQPQGQQTQGQQTQQNDNQQSRMNQHGQNAQDQNAQNQSTNDRQSQNKNQQSAQDQQSQQGNQQSAENNQPIRLKICPATRSVRFSRRCRRMASMPAGWTDGGAPKLRAR